MARSFNSATPDYFKITSALPSGVPWPVTCAGWFKSATAATQAIVSIEQTASTGYLVLRVDGSHVVSEYFDGTNNPSAVTSATYTSGAWSHAAMTCANAAQRSVYLDGANVVSDTTAASDITLTGTSLGRLNRSSPAYSFNGSLAECAIWSVVLDASELAALGKGFCPKLIRPQSLIAYWDLGGNNSPEQDRWKSKFDVTAGGSPAKADHPRIFYAF